MMDKGSPDYLPFALLTKDSDTASRIDFDHAVEKFSDACSR